MNSLDRHVIGQLLRVRGVEAWGVAANDPPLPGAPDLPVAISLLMHIDRDVVQGLRHGPTAEYHAEYLRLNEALDKASGILVGELRGRGHAAQAVPATYDGNGHGEDQAVFPHKTAATAAGLGWIGKTALFVSPEFGPAVRLATVFTDLPLPTGDPVSESACGACRDCVTACPAGCGRDVLWRAGMPREELFDAGACRHHMDQYDGMEHQICGICIAACPYARKD